MEVRLLAERDINSFKELRFKALTENPESYLSHIEDEKILTPGEFAAKVFSWEEPPSRFVVGAFDGRRLLATCGFRREPGLNLRHKGELWAVYVAPEGRGLGLGKAVLTAAIEAAGALHGMEIINVFVAGENAAGFYEHFGFRTFGQEQHAKKVNGQYVDLTYMALDLTEKD